MSKSWFCKKKAKVKKLKKLHMIKELAAVFKHQKCLKTARKFFDLAAAELAAVFKHFWCLKTAASSLIACSQRF